MSAMPITILGAFAALFLNFTLPAYSALLPVWDCHRTENDHMFTTNFLADDIRGRGGRVMPGK